MNWYKRLINKTVQYPDRQSPWPGTLAANTGAMHTMPGGAGEANCVNVAGKAVFLSGRSAVQYQVSPRGPVALDALRNPLFGSAACSAVLRTLVTAPSSHLLADEYARVMARALGAGNTLTTALAGGPALATVFPSNNSLADQLKMVARMVSVAQALGARRQVFLVSLGGFDTHAGQAAVHPALLGRLAGAMRAFHDASQGGRFYGTAPVIANNGPDDVGQGRLLPSTSVDQYAATLGRWFGIGDTDLLGVLPNLGWWDVGVRGVGFV